MQDIFVFKPYQFVPPVRSRILSKINRLLKLHRHLIWRLEGVRGYEVHHADRLRESLRKGNGILLAPNHSRTADPIALGFLGEELNLDMYAMASWHLFNVSNVMSWFIRSMGAFSVNREGMDRKSIDTAVQILVDADRPLVVFPEGSTSRTNDRLMPFLDGVSFIARTAAKKREKENGGKVVVHPLAFKYLYHGELLPSIEPLVEDLESRLTWYPNRGGTILERLERIALAQLTLKEIERLGAQQEGPLEERLQRMVNHYLWPAEEKWLGSRKEGHSSARIKNLRARIVPTLIEEGESSPNKHAYLADIHDTYIAHQMASHPLPYLKQNVTTDRVRETVERLQEDATDNATLHRPLKCVIDIGEPIEVSTRRERREDGKDPLMMQVYDSLQSLLDGMVALSPPFHDQPSPNNR